MSILRACGGCGDVSRARVARMADLLGGLPPVLDGPDHLLHGSERCTPRADPAGPAVAWAAAPTGPFPRSDWRGAAAHADACGLVASADATLVHSSISGATPLYVDVDDHGVHFATSLTALAQTAQGPLRADWDAWAGVIAIGAPLQGRTPFVGFQRLPPWTALRVTTGDHAVSTDRPAWPWLAVEPADGDHRLGELRDALTAVVGGHAGRGRLASLLSGGWDSRLLAAAARHVTADAGTAVRAWTTSSDSGTALEELVAASVAARLGIDHVVVPARHDRFADDVTTYADAVDHQTSFHVWLVPLAERLGGQPGTVLDGLGGGIFVGGAFPDPGDGVTSLPDARFGRLARYLEAGEDVLRPEVVAQLRARTRAGFDATVGDLVDHPAGATFTAYLIRTLPGISLGPMGLVAGRAPTAVPFLDDTVVRAALAVPAAERADGRLYPRLVAAFSPEAAREPTAADLAGPRHHVRRGASRAAAAWYRQRLTTGPVADLLAPSLRRADLDVWSVQLGRTRQQHLVRSLAVLSLWLERHDGRLASTAVDELAVPVG